MRLDFMELYLERKWRKGLTHQHDGEPTNLRPFR